MPVCALYRGDCSNLALDQPGCFVLKDALGRDWFCVRTELAEIPADFSGMVAELLRVQGLAHKQGFSAEGTEQMQIRADDEGELARKLVEATYPPPEQSAERLLLAGWYHSTEEFGTGQPCRVAVSNGRQTVKAAGATSAEAWHRAAQRALQEQTSMTPPIQPDPVPLIADGRRGLRVGDSRVSLDTVIREYARGAGPEGIVAAYSTLQLADVYTVIGYYLRHRDEVEEYLRRREAEAAELRREIESQQPAGADLRAKLLARRNRQEQDHASAGR